MKLVEKSLQELKEAEYNPRISLDSSMMEYQKLKTSIETFGYIEPIVWNERTGNVIGGHQRLTILKDLGKESAVVSVVNLSEKEEKLLNVALNKIKGDWDKEKLEELLSDFDTSDILAAGFNPNEIALLQSDSSDLENDINDCLEQENDWFEEESEYYGASWVITLQFESTYLAKCWAEKHGYEEQIRDNSFTTVIRM